MSRKHNTRHQRSRSNYPKRLSIRGVSSRAVHMLDLDDLRGIARRLAEPEHDTYDPDLVAWRAHVARVQLRRPLYEGSRPYPITLEV